jgi:biotin carboxylase
VIIGFAEALAAAEAAWSLVDQGYRVTAAARRGRGSALRYSRHVTCHDVTPPETDAAAAVSDLNRLIAETSHADGGQPAAFLPLDDSAVWLGQHLELGAGCIWAGPSGADADLALDKRKQIEAARRAGFNVPDTAVLPCPEALATLSAPYPFVVKPARAVWPSGSRLCKERAYVCADRGEQERVRAKWPREGALLVQPFLTGAGEGVFGLAVNGEVRAWSAHRRLRMMNPEGSGSSACVSRPVPDDVRPAVERFVRETGWQGLFMVELLRDSHGTPWFIEFNGRAWGSMALSRRQGLEYAAWSVALALDPRSPIGRQSAGRPELVCRNVAREFLHLLFVLRGPSSTAFRQWPPFWRTMRQVLGVRRGDGIYNWRKDDPVVLLGDFYCTLRANLLKARN